VEPKEASKTAVGIRGIFQEVVPRFHHGEDITPGGTIFVVGGGCFKDMHLFIPNWN